YRHFIVRGPEGQGARDDTAAMDEVLRRRLRRLNDDAAHAADAGGVEDAGAPTAAPRRFAYRPDLLVVDGGLPQVNA
ncbi:hypothetical protein OJ604_11905, partial [Streptococcus anginosus]|nr:hypothetical protein [Streptococcus anginosus]